MKRTVAIVLSAVLAGWMSQALLGCSGGEHSTTTCTDAGPDGGASCVTTQVPSGW